MKTRKVGTRGSRLALAQTQIVIDRLREQCPDDAFETVVIRSTGDKITNMPLNQIGGSGIFTVELESALLNGYIDFAVHSMKDLPVCQPEGLRVISCLQREDPRDALIFLSPLSTLSELPSGARIGTGSLRRGIQLKALRPDLVVVPIRGNVDTRLNKVGTEMDGVVLAAAGLIRAGLAERITRRFSAGEMLPAPMQGILALEYRTADEETGRLLTRLIDRDTELAATTERAFLKATGAGCHAPVGAFAVCEDGLLWLSGLYGKEGYDCFVTGSASAPADCADSLGAALADELLCRYKERYG